ncbi:MAG: hypothetical protein KBG48_06805 [Kofleriaceae bacterium]|nr:hypothetical protein [Kofleriaceae bacterium]MBP9167078.1 hypothetical protein [Kofleriaceae bacterium]MBP9861929.1 hypothetical protein [Kofleriaceae bacterium]
MRLAALAAVACAVAPGCAAPPAVDELRVLSPTAAVEVVPVAGYPLGATWSYAGDPAEVALTLVPDRAGGATVPLGRTPATAGAATWTVTAPAPRHGTYRLRADAYLTGVAAAAATAWAPAIVLMQGASFRDSTLTFTGADPERDVWVEATVGRPIAIELVARRDGAGPPQILARGSIASDLAPIGRVYRWPTVDVDGAPVEAGTYAVVLAVTSADGERYLVDGLEVAWQP